MSDWSILALLVTAALMGWLIVRLIRKNPGAFTKEALSSSLFTMGVLALLLIGVVLLAILLLK